MLLSGSTKTDVVENDIGAQAAVPIADVKPNLWYPLIPKGANTAKAPLGVLSVEEDSFTANAGGALGADVDYVLDADNGMVLFKDTAKVRAGNITVGFTPNAGTREGAAASISPVDIRRAILFREATNRKRRLFVRRASIGAEGDVPFKRGPDGRETVSEFTLSCGVEDPGNGHPPVEIDGVAV